MSDKKLINSKDWNNATIYEFKAIDIDGNIVDLSKYRNKVCLIVNVACNCGYTELTYKQLQELHDKYKNSGLCILAFPCNQFADQEPGTEKEIKEFVNQYNINFDMFSKINVNGNEAHPLYKYLKFKVLGNENSSLKWNFSKFLIDKHGIPVKHFRTNVEPFAIETDILHLLNPDSKL